MNNTHIIRDNNRNIRPIHERIPYRNLDIIYIHRNVCNRCGALQCYHIGPCSEYKDVNGDIIPEYVPNVGKK